jgi:hypothetical protein
MKILVPSESCVREKAPPPPGAARHLGRDKAECPPLPPTGADGKPAHMARAHRTVLPAALIRPRPLTLSARLGLTGKEAPHMYARHSGVYVASERLSKTVQLQWGPVAELDSLDNHGRTFAE